MNKRTIYAFLIGLVGFPLCASIALSFASWEYEPLGKLLFGIIGGTFFTAVIVVPLYLFVGCPLWYFLWKIGFRKKWMYLISAGIVAFLSHTLFWFGGATHIFLQNTKSLLSVVPVIFTSSAPLILLTVGTAYLMWKVGVQEKEKGDNQP